MVYMRPMKDHVLLSSFDLVSTFGEESENYREEYDLYRDDAPNYSSSTRFTVTLQWVK
jgi:hypothetical protein